MKTINIKSTYPGFANGHIVYESSISTINNGNYGSGFAQYNIETEVKNNLVALFICSSLPNGSRTYDHINYPIGDVKTFLLGYSISKGTNDNCVVSVKIPFGCICNYRISGDKNLSINLNDISKEISLVDSDVSGDYSHLLHKHDGIDSPKINLENLKPSPGNANKFVKVSSDGTSFIYSTATALGGFALTTPAYNAILDMSLTSTLFNWGDSSGATSYRIIITDEITDSIVLDVSGIVASQYTVLHSLFSEGKTYQWNVIATDGTNSTTASQFTFRTNIITS